MSSRYEVSYLMTHKNSEPNYALPEYRDGNVVIVNNPNEVTYLDHTNFQQIFKQQIEKQTPYVLYKIPGNFSCRESILYHAYRNMQEMREEYFHPALLVEYNYQEGELNNQKIQMIIKIGEIFFSGKYNPIKIFPTPQKENSVTISYTWDDSNLGESSEDLSKVSMLLYVFRSDYIMEKILDNLKDSDRGLEVLFGFLAVEFLKHEDWGNSNNPGIALSLFCYRVSENIQQTSIDFFANGPATLAQYIPDTLTLLEYLKNVYIPVKGGICIRCNDFSYCDPNFKQSLVLLMELLNGSGKDNDVN